MKLLCHKAGELADPTPIAGLPDALPFVVNRKCNGKRKSGAPQRNQRHFVAPYCTQLQLLHQKKFRAGKDQGISRFDPAAAAHPLRHFNATNGKSNQIKDQFFLRFDPFND